MDYAKNFKTKDVILRAAAFALYFFAAGFMGKLCADLAEPAFSFVLSGYPEIKNIILYIISVITALAAVSFFARREGHGDAGLRRYNYRRNVLAFIISGLIFSWPGSLVLSNGAVSDYFYTPCFIPAEINNILGDYVFFPKIPILYNAAEYIKYLMTLKPVNLYFFIFICVIFGMGFYKSGRNKQI